MCASSHASHVSHPCQPVYLYPRLHFWSSQIIVKEKGVFSNVTSPSTKAKLRILFEVAPLGLLVSAIRLQNLHSRLAAARFCACCDDVTCCSSCSTE